MCLFPTPFPNKRYQKTIKNGGYPPVLKDRRAAWIMIPCGTCEECRRKKCTDWMARIIEDRKDDATCRQFVTLSFSPEALRDLCEATGLDECNAIATIAVRRFLERWRKKYKKSVKHWFITELGHKNSERIHLHGFLWTEEGREKIERIWKYGNVEVGYDQSNKTVTYITKYMLKPDKQHRGYKSIVLTSPGIGKGYIDRAGINKFSGKKTNTKMLLENLVSVELCQYYKRKLYTDRQREQLRLWKMDENKAYVDGVEYNLGNPLDEELYYKRLDKARQRDIELGYHTNRREQMTKYNVTKYMLMNYKELVMKKAQRPIYYETREEMAKKRYNPIRLEFAIQAFESEQRNTFVSAFDEFTCTGILNCEIIFNNEKSRGTPN